MYWPTSSRCSAQTLLALTLLIPVLAFAPVAPAAESADEAKDFGIIDEVLNSRASTTTE